MTQQEPRVRAALFNDVPAAKRAVSELVQAGFSKEAVSVVASEARRETFDAELTVAPAGEHTAEAAALGGSLGAILGATALGLGAAATGGAGLVFLGPLMVGVAGGGIAGGFVGAMTTRGLEPEVADFYDQAVGNGQILVSVEDSETPTLASAERIFERAGAEPLSLTRD